MWLFALYHIHVTFVLMHTLFYRVLVNKMITQVFT